ncbi:exodeoxyribonuclease V subunit alpha [Thalassolituus sp. LLYu03]|uniref:exodeoxyribonuclease V subunit alpha n=1 Tax=Thalassolituus sp. LLYu03 TaxID=3421656 RepID=UPI003D2A14DD
MRLREPTPLAGVRDIDRQLADQIVRYETSVRDPGTDTGPLWLSALMVSIALGKGQVCLPLSMGLSVPAGLSDQWQASGVDELVSVLARCHTVFNTASGADYARQPLVLDGTNLYLARYYFYQQSLLEFLQQRLQHGVTEAADDTTLTAILQPLFPSTDGVDWQKVAAATACTQRLAVITGGPGTGKTTTVTRLLSALLSVNPDLSVALAAPTGKAAARMTESIRNARLKASAGALPYAERIPDESFTLHRLLGWTPRGFRYNRERSLPFDCVVVDEASMVDLPMMHHLFAALAPHARLILLGDRDQLASVEAGSVLADLCDAGTQHGPSLEFAQRLSGLTGYDLMPFAEAAERPIQNAVAQLRVSHRFDANSGIGQLAQAVNSSNLSAAAQAFQRFSDIEYFALQQDSRNPWWTDRRFQDRIVQGHAAYCAAVQQQMNNPQQAQAVLDAFNEFQVLVALRQSVYGVTVVNQRIEQLLQSKGLLNTPQMAGNAMNQGSGAWYAGRPVMINRNDYDLGLFNGDIGIALMAADGSGQLKVAFPASDGSVRWLLPSRLPEHETAFAMTVHKSQGSEFTELCLLLPDQWQSVITRELIYTAITRARERFCLFTSDACWQQGLITRVQRASGLRDALWGARQA